ncbi:MAG: hypothetical protein WC459_04425 [Patescibacteria group bacterium]
MLFLQIYVGFILILVIFIIYQNFTAQIKPKPLAPIPTVVINNNVVKTTIRDVYYQEIRYSLNIGDEQRTPMIIYRRNFDGDLEIQLGSKGKMPAIKNYGAHQVALLEEAIKDIRGHLVNKKA